MVFDEACCDVYPVLILLQHEPSQSFDSGWISSLTVKNAYCQYWWTLSYTIIIGSSSSDKLAWNKSGNITQHTYLLDMIDRSMVGHLEVRTKRWSKRKVQM